MIRSIRTRQRTIEPGDGTLPPESPVPLPRATTGTLSLAASLSTATTSDEVRGKTTALGRALRTAVPSKE